MVFLTGTSNRQMSEETWNILLRSLWRHPRIKFVNFLNSGLRMRDLSAIILWGGARRNLLILSYGSLEGSVEKLYILKNGSKVSSLDSYL
jgi:hypothetical protein